MPDMANLTVKKADGTTDITYVATQPSAGDDSPAVWKSTYSGIAAFNAELRVVTRPSKDRGIRRTELNFNVPHIVQGTDGVWRITDTTRITATVLTPQKVATTSTDEAVAQGLNLLSSTLIKTVAQTGYAPS